MMLKIGEFNITIHRSALQTNNAEEMQRLCRYVDKIFEMGRKLEQTKAPLSRGKSIFESYN